MELGVIAECDLHVLLSMLLNPGLLPSLSAGDGGIRREEAEP